MILPAGSPLVQFEKTQRAHGGNFPLGLKWVNRNPIKPTNPGFSCGGPVFRVEGDDYTFVCPCMGRFVE